MISIKDIPYFSLINRFFEQVGIIYRWGSFMKKILLIGAVLLFLPFATSAGILPDSGQTTCFDNTQEITCPNPGEDFYGQDANYVPCNPHSYTKLDANSNPLPDDTPGHGLW